MRRLKRILCGCVVIVASCDGPTDVDSSTGGGTSPGVSTNLAANSPRWLAVGTKVKVGDPISAPPEPYNPSKYGPALTGPTEFENLAARPDFVRPPKRGRSAAPGLVGLAVPPPGTGDRGFFLYQNSRPWFGAYAVYDLNLNLGLPMPWSSNGVYLYAPTMMPPGGTCIEVTQVYRRLPGGNTTGKLFGIFDWCQSGAGEFDVFEAQVTTWTNRYVRTYQGKATYAVSIVTPNTGSTMGQCWYANLYDYILGGWVQRLARCGTPVHGWNLTGWTMWESWWLTNTSSCPSLPSIRSLDIALYDPTTGAPTPFTDSPSDLAQLGPSGTCWQTGTYTFVTPIPGLATNTWRGNTPNQ